MKKSIIYISAAAFALLFSACERVEEIEAPVSGQVEEMRFVASIESGADTKTMIDGNVGDETRHLKWLPEDAIGVYNNSSRKFEKFVNVNSETSASGVFEGANTVQDVYYAVYPYSESHSYADRDKIMTVDLPVVQNYAENTFGNGANPMVAHAEGGEELMFQNLCGVLVINLTGSVTVKSMSVTLLDESGNLAPVSGKHTVSMDYIEEPSLNSTEESTRSVTLDCGEGVALNSAEPTPFHIVVPAGTYNGITLSVVTADGQMMVKHGQNQLKIRRRRVTSAGALGWETVVAVDLSERGTSNCYIVSEPGVYSFDATTIGNGEFGLIPDAGFHTDDVKISPSTVELLWEDVPGLVQSVYCVNGRAGFYSSGKEGNAVLVAKDASGTIIWSWHIWGTDRPAEHNYNGGNLSFAVLDRYLGAVAGEKSNEREKILYFQWGRKDPLLPGTDFSTNENRSYSLIESISKPNVMATNNFVEHQCSLREWMEPYNDKLWLKGQKTIYDPCPVGYKVVDPDVFLALSTAPIVYDMGFEVSYNGVDYAYFPISDHYNGRGSIINDATSYSLTSVNGQTLSVNASSMNIVDCFRSSPGVPVRCMKDDGYVDISCPQVDLVSFSEITETSAKVVANVRAGGASEVTERGIIWGADSELSDGVKVSCGNGVGEFSCELTDLESGSIYYVKAYAVNDHGESYTDVRVFSTHYSVSDAVNLSENETANAYIVSSPGLYTLNCLVKGNSTESVGTPVSAAVVWETKNTDAPVSAGDIIDNVELHGGYLYFEIPMPFTPGNALVAIKDASGNILWSWHIWVTDFDPELTAQTYISGAVMMDRNLGALRSTPGDPSVNGFFYQWGRKDPLLNAANSSSIITAVPSDVKNYVASDEISNTLEYSIQHPSTVVTDPTWMKQGDDLWARNKTIYDPCPAGWRIPGSEVWEGIPENRHADNGFYISAPYSEPAAFYPGAGYVGERGGDIECYGSVIYVWAYSTPNMNEAYTMCMFGNNTIHDMMRPAGKATQFPVRCMKE